MKKHLVLALSFSLISAAAQSQAPAPAGEIIKEACHTAAAAHKNVFIIFHASWCGWCHRMDSIMESAGCKKLFTDHYVIRHIDVLESPDKKGLENPGGEALMKKYHGEKQGIPYWLILDKDGKLLADSRIKPAGADPDGAFNNSGCPARPEEVAYFIRVLKETSPLQKTALAVIKQSFQEK